MILIGHGRSHTLWQALIIVCIASLVLPGLCTAEPAGPPPHTRDFGDVLPIITNPLGVSSSGSVPTPVPAQTIRAPPPTLIVEKPVVDGLTATVYGSVIPGSMNESIKSIRWDWGDTSSAEYHDFPYSHVYAGPGSYTLSITALQSDGQKDVKTTTVGVVQGFFGATLPSPMNSSVPGMPSYIAIMQSPPVLTLLEPVIDGMNVTVNGNLNPASPGLSIESVEIDWDDGSSTTSADFPVSHVYSDVGVYTISVTGNQSNGLSVTKRMALDLKEHVPGTPGQGGPGPGAESPPIIVIIVVTAVVVALIGAFFQRAMFKKILGLQAPGPTKPFFPKGAPLSEGFLSSAEIQEIVLGTDVSPEVLLAVLRISVEITREGREGQAIGTSFIVGDTETVLSHSKQFVLNPFQGHAESSRLVTDLGTRGNIKEFAQLDGAFIISGTGVVEAAGRCLTVDLSHVDLPGGLGSRHSSVAGVTQVSKSIGIVVSQSGLVSIVRDGRIIRTISP